MSDLRELYQQVIIDHGRNPRNFFACRDATHMKEGYNPLCGDHIVVYILEKDSIVHDISFQGSGCAISMASASLMTEALKGKKISDVENYFNYMRQLLTGNLDAIVLPELKKLAVLSGVSEFPARVKCATLCWHTVKSALLNSDEMVSTE